MENIKRKTIVDKIFRSSFLAITCLCSLCVVFIAIFIFIKGLTPFFKKYEINGSLYSVNCWKFIFGNMYSQTFENITNAAAIMLYVPYTDGNEAFYRSFIICKSLVLQISRIENAFAV